MLLAPLPSGADVVLDWNALMIDAIRGDNTAPTLSTRNLAIMHTAIYDSVNSVLRTHQPYLSELDTPEETSPEAAAVGAAYEIMKILYPPFSGSTEELYTSWLESTPQTAATTNGLALGKQIGELALQNRVADGSSTDVPYIPSDAPGAWRRTPPNFRPPLTPQWRYVTPFCLPGLEPFLPPPPPALNSLEYAESLNQVKAIGSMETTVRTAEEALIASFWSDFSYTAMPPGHFHEIAANIARDQNNSLADNARLFALLSLAQADGAIVCWEAKYAYNLWRPVTAIQRANEDDNSRTEADPTWQQYLPSPPFPSYPSGHSTFSKASAQVLTHFYGTDAITFTTTSDTDIGVIRCFQSLAACADEIGLSRIYGGFHFSFDDVHGQTSGAKIADFVSANYLLANDSLPTMRIESFQEGALLMRLQGLVGHSYVIETSTNLEDWQPLSTNQAMPGGLLVEAPNATGTTRRFYRAREL
jgi:membrane-associated phospholipid phosphatase